MDEAWTIKQAPTHCRNDLEPAAEYSIDAYVSAVQGWLNQWVTSDHCPLIHRYLYSQHRQGMPRLVQDAYAATCVYVHKTPATAATAHRIVEDRLVQLVGADELELDPGMKIEDHLARVQSLLVLIVICLFDGHIRLRSQAEMHIATLLVWNDQMWQAGISRYRYNLDGEDPWRAWIVCESMRRTWLTVSIVQGVYMTLKHGFSWCPGSVFATFGRALWDAVTGREWERVTASDEERECLFKQSLEVGELFDLAGPEDVDEYASVSFDYGFFLQFLCLGLLIDLFITVEH